MIRDAAAFAILVLLVLESVLIIVNLIKTNRFLRNLKNRYPATWVGLGKPEPAWIKMGWSNDPTLLNFLRGNQYRKILDHTMVEEADGIKFIQKIALCIFGSLMLLAIYVIFFA